MNYLYYSATPLDSQNTAVLIDNAYTVLNTELDSHVYFLICDGFPNNFCEFNFEKSCFRCLECKFVNKTIFRRVNKNNRFTLLKISDFINKNKYQYSQNVFPHNLQELKKLEYNGINIGYGIVSSFVSITRNIKPEFNDVTSAFFDNFISSSKALIDVLFKITEQIDVSYIKVFNGRYGLIRPLVEFARFKGISYSTFEKPAPYEKVSRMVEYKNAMPHTISYRTKFINDVWEQSANPEKNKIASSFYENRRNGIAAADKVYIDHQVKGMLPDNFDSSKRNFVIFNSSEDEFFSIDNDWEEKSLLGSQIQGIQKICELLNPHKDIHLYLRVHPNLKGIPFYYADSIAQSLKQFDNITVIPSESPISTYDLLDVCEKCIIFGSSVGVEANFWGVPSILLSGSSYYYLDVCYIPHGIEELENLLLKHLEPKSKLGCLKYSYALMEQNIGYHYHYFDFNMGKIKFAGKILEYAKGIKILGSSYLYRMLCILCRVINFKRHESFIKTLSLLGKEEK